MGRARAAVALVCVGALTLGACASDDNDDGEVGAGDSTTITVAPDDSTTTTTPATEDATPAASLRTSLNLLLAEHVILASDATGAALGGRTDEYDAAVAALGANSQALADAIGSVYGAEAGEAFLPLWEKHIGFFVDYTTALAADDQAAADEAAANLAAYADEFGAFLNSASPELPTDAVASLVTMHIGGLLAVIDAQAEGDYSTAYTGLREATAHMREIADALTATIVAQFPEQFPASAAGTDPGTTDTTEAAVGGDGVVTVRIFQFEPSDITVSAGTEVTWENDDDTTHEPTSGEPGAATDDFAVVLEGPDATGSVTLDEPGSYPYFCAIHESMTGTIVVE